MPSRLCTATQCCRLSLKPAIAHCLPPAASTSRRQFHESRTRQMPRKNAGPRGNKLRGMSAIRGDGVQPWINLSVTKEDVKTPRKIKHLYEPTPEDHGLWKFFNWERKILSEPYEEGSHGRAWTHEEIRRKSFNDIHELWWACLYERNRIITENWTRKVTLAGFGEAESMTRKEVVEETMRNIKQTLRERWNAWEQARKLASEDESIYTDDEKNLIYDIDADEDFQQEPEPDSISNTTSIQPHLESVDTPGEQRTNSSTPA